MENGSLEGPRTHFPCSRSLDHLFLAASGGYVVPGDDAQPARVDAVLATSRAFGNFRFKDAAQTPGGAWLGYVGMGLGIKKQQTWDLLGIHVTHNWDTYLQGVSHGGIAR